MQGCLLMKWRSMALNREHQLRIRIKTPIMLQQTIWTVLMRMLLYSERLVVAMWPSSSQFRLVEENTLLIILRTTVAIL